MKITKLFLEKHNACQSGMDYVTANDYIGLPAKDFILKLIKDEKYDWTNALFYYSKNYRLNLSAILLS